MDEDARQLDLLSIFHYILAGLVVLIGFFPVIHLVVGILMVRGEFQGRGQGPPDWFGFLFIFGALFMIISIWALAIALGMAAGRLKRRVGYTFCLVVAGIECTFVPFGTVLGVLTIVVLTRPSVKILFGIQPARPASC